MGVGGAGMSTGVVSDLDLAVQGGPAFTQRLEELRESTEKHQKAVEALLHGQNAVEALDKASRLLAQAKEERAGILAGANAEAEAARKAVNEWAEATKLRLMTVHDETQAALADAQSKQEAAAAALASAQSTSTEAKKAAATLIEDANIKAEDIVDAAHKQADKITAKIKVLEAAAQKALADTQATKAKYDRALEAIRAAAVE